ncbi:MAG: TetR/AcrR family transcriptional regulator [Deltaproteobacteria bacterium]|nr:TetR/AcrR family transcriptional regulator [Deltaproteobacteria bacterium]
MDQGPGQTTCPTSDPTQERILDEAELLFACQGFHGVSVRAITKAAGCHLSAVNYHFGSKENLYLEVFRCRWVPRGKKLLGMLQQMDAQPTVTVQEVVGALAFFLFSHHMEQEQRLRHQGLMSKELDHPGPALELVVNEVIRPHVELAARLLSRAMPDYPEPERLKLCVFSILAQALFFRHGSPIVSKVLGVDYDSAFASLLTRHITDFCLHGLTNSGDPS